MSCRCNYSSKPENKMLCSRDKENANRFSSSKNTPNVRSTSKPYNTQSSRTPLLDLKTINKVSTTSTTKTVADLHSRKPSSSTNLCNSNNPLNVILNNLDSFIQRAAIAANENAKVKSGTVKNSSSTNIKNSATVKSTTNTKTVANQKTVAASKNVSASSIKSCARVATNNTAKTVSSTTNKTSNTISNTSHKNTSVNNSKTVNKSQNSSSTAVKNTKTVSNVGNTAIKNTSNNFKPSASSTIITNNFKPSASSTIITSSNFKNNSVCAKKVTSKSSSTNVRNTASSNIKNTAVSAIKVTPRSCSTIISNTTSANIKNTSFNANIYKSSSIIVGNTTSSNIKNTAVSAVKLTPRSSSTIISNTTSANIKNTSLNANISRSNSTILKTTTCADIKNTSLSTSKFIPRSNSTIIMSSNASSNMKNTSVNKSLVIATPNKKITVNSTVNKSVHTTSTCSNISKLTNKNNSINTNVTQNKTVTTVSKNTSQIISSNCSNKAPNKFINTVVPVNKSMPAKNYNSVVLNTKNNTSNATLKTTPNSVNLSLSAVSTNSTKLKLDFNNASITAVNKSTNSTNVSINTTGDFTTLPHITIDHEIFPKISSSRNNNCINPSNIDINLTDLENSKVGNTYNDLNILPNNEIFSVIDSRIGTEIAPSAITLNKIKSKNITFGPEILETRTENTSNTMQATLSSEIVKTDIFRKADNPIIQDGIESLEIVHIEPKTRGDNTPLTSLTVSDKDNTLVTSLDKITCKSVKFSPEIIQAEIFSTPDTTFIEQSKNPEDFSKTETPFTTSNKIKPKSVKFSSEISKIETCSSPITIKCETLDQTESTIMENGSINSRTVTFNTFCSTIPAVEISSSILNKMFPLASSTDAKCSKNNICVKNDGIDETSRFWQTLQFIKSVFKNNKSVINCDTTQIYTNTNGILERSVHDGIPKKKTFKKEILKPSEYLGVVNLDSNTHKVHPLLLYPDDLLHDVINHIITHQMEYKLKIDVLDANVELCEMRSIVVNWLVKLHQYLAPDTCILFMVIRLFDKILALLNIPENKYQIYALTTYWIVLKYNNSDDFTTAPDILKLCNNKYSIDYFLVMEKQILHYLNYNMNVDEPMIFVHYFIYVMKLPDCNIISFCANYFLEILSLAHNCNCFPLSLQAASAIYLTLKLFDIDESYWLVIKKYQGYHEQDEMLSLHKLIIEQILLMNEEEYPYKESYKKFSSEKYDKVSVQVAMKMAEFF